LSSLPELKMATDNTLGSSSVAPTLYATDQLSPNVIPGQVKLTLDWRNVPGESPEEIVAKLQALLDESLSRDQLGNASRATVQVTAEELTTYTGMKKTFSSIFPAFILSEADPFVRAARAALIGVLGRDEGVDTWKFATDGGHLIEAGIPTIGFGPGDERLAHTNQERISLAQMEEATVAYVALILTLAEVAQQQT
jgi:succinyl-diaminopimelate desuccinylase